MDKAKAAVSEFLHKDGKHHTTVHETTAPAVQHEHITPTHHENVTTAIDRDVHQDHHHTTVQPIHHKEVLPEQHSHNIAGVEEREIHHGDSTRTKERLEAERAQFKDTREVGSTQHTQSAAPTIAGEHVHHHVHENIQPVIEKQTIQPSVVHTTVPIHETHHNEAKHHTATTLPAVSLSEFQKSGHSLSGHSDRTDHFEGAPRNIAETLGAGGVIGGHGAKGDTHITDRDGDRSGYSSTGTHHNSGLTGSHGTHNGSSGLTGTHGSSGPTGTHGSSGLTGTHGTHNGSSGLTGSHSTGTAVGGGVGGGVASSTHHDTSRTSIGNNHSGTTSTKKPSLLDKINPKVDADGDGKAGFMK